MAARKGRSPLAASITQASIEKAINALSQLPEKPKTNWSLRETVHQLQDTITTALERGYSHQEIAEMLAEQGIRISPTSLKAYLAANSREAGVAPKRRRTATKAAAVEEAAPAPEAEETPEEAAPKKPRGRRPGSSNKESATSSGRKAVAETAAPRTRRKKTATANAS